MGVLRYLVTRERGGPKAYGNEGEPTLQERECNDQERQPKQRKGRKE